MVFLDGNCARFIFIIYCSLNRIVTVCIFNNISAGFIFNAVYTNCFSFNYYHIIDINYLKKLTFYGKNLKKDRCLVLFLRSMQD